MSLNHSFYVQNWASGGEHRVLGSASVCNPGAHSLNVNGVITQKFRGPVGTFNGSTRHADPAGTTRTTRYDTRLKYLSPPYFLSPTQSAWIRISYAELKPSGSVAKASLEPVVRYGRRCSRPCARCPAVPANREWRRRMATA